MIPMMGQKCQVETKGLKWNIGEAYDVKELSWDGGLISTSNEVVEEEIKIKSTGSLIFSTSLNYI